MIAGHVMHFLPQILNQEFLQTSLCLFVCLLAENGTETAIGACLISPPKAISVVGTLVFI